MSVTEDDGIEIDTTPGPDAVTLQVHWVEETLVKSLIVPFPQTTSPDVNPVTSSSQSNVQTIGFELLLPPFVTPPPVVPQVGLVVS